MEWNVILNEVFKVVLIPLLGIVVKYFIQFINLKTAEFKATTDNALYIKYLDMLNETIVNAVITTNQTYVDALKNQGAFDAEAQAKAFQMTYDAVIQVLGEEARKYLTSAVGDLNEYIRMAIESQVNINKLTSAG